MPEAKRCADDGVVTGKYITYTALPYPLPKCWQDELKIAAKAHAGDAHYLEALERRMRNTIGFEYTRKVILPVMGRT